LSIAFWTGLSRVAALLRDTVLSHLFGANHLTDAFLAAFFVPDTFRTLVAESGLSPAIIPALVAARRKPDLADASRLLGVLLGWLPLLAAAVTLAGVLLAPVLMRWLTPGFAADPQVLDSAVSALRTMLPYLVLSSAIAPLIATLQVDGRFGIAASTSLVFNCVHIVAIMTLAMWTRPASLGLSLGVLLGGLAQLLLLGAVLLPSGGLPRPSLGSHPALGGILAALAPVAAALAGYQLSVLVLPIFASRLGEAAVSQIYYADRFARLPTGLIGVAVATAALPRFAAADQDGGREGLAAHLRESLRLSHRISIPAAIGLAALSEPIVAGLLQHGRFGVEATIPTARAICGFCVGLVAISDIRVVCQVFFALGRRREPMLLSVAAVAITAALSGPLAHRLGVAGLALSVSLAAWAQLIVLLACMRRLDIGWRPWEMVLCAGRDLLAALLMAVAAVAVARLGRWQQGTTAVNILILLGAVGTGCVVYSGLQALAVWRFVKGFRPQ